MKLVLKSTAELMSELKHQHRADTATVKELERRWEETTKKELADESGSINKITLRVPDFAIRAGTERS